MDVEIGKIYNYINTSSKTLLHKTLKRISELDVKSNQ